MIYSPKSDTRTSSTTLTLHAAFSRLTSRDIDQLRRVAVLRTYPAGTVLCHEGHVERVFYVLQSGTVKITNRVSDTEERLLALRGPGEFFGEMALVDDSPRSASVTAITDVAVIEITDDDFVRVLENSPALARTLLLRSQQILRENLQKQIAELKSKNAALEKAYHDLQAAQAELVRNARMKRDLEVAAQVQRSILPTTFPKAAGVSFAAHAQPAREIGGDFYDVFQLDDRHFGMLIADVSDKSIHAAIFMAVSRTLFVTQVHHHPSPREVLLATHKLLLDISSADNMFVTAFYGVLDLDSYRLTYARAGHDHPLLLRADGRIEFLYGAGRFLGMLEGLNVEERVAQLQPGDRLVLYSDGVTDATNERGQNYSTERLQDVVSRRRAAAASELADAIIDDVLLFQGDEPQFDDITLLVAAID